MSLLNHPDLNSFQRNYIKDNIGKDRTPLLVKILVPFIFIIPTTLLSLQAFGIETEFDGILDLTIWAAIIIDFVGIFLFSIVVLMDGIFYLNAYDAEPNSEGIALLHEYMIDKLALERTDFLYHLRAIFINSYHAAFILALAATGWVFFAFVELFIFGLTKLLTYILKLTTANYFLTLTPEKLNCTKVIQGGENGTES